MEMGNQEWNSGITKKWKWSEALSFERKVLSSNESF
jgi:hypothetical protein